MSPAPTKRSSAVERILENLAPQVLALPHRRFTKTIAQRACSQLAQAGTATSTSEFIIPRTPERSPCTTL